MKGNPKIIEAMNGLLASELSAISEYIVHSEICENWGYDKLADYIKLRAKDEMKHAEKLISRILFLEGFPVVDKLSPIYIGDEIPKQFTFDHLAEEGAIKDYNEAIALCAELKDDATKEILQDNLEDEDRHINEIENYQAQIAQMGLPIFLSTKA